VGADGHGPRIRRRVRVCSWGDGRNAFRRGQTVPVADVLIAATAIARGRVLVSANVAHIDRMKPFGLCVENWREATQPHPR